MIFPPEPSKECFKVSHVIFECRVINHHPFKIRTLLVQIFRMNQQIHKSRQLIN